MLSAALVLLLAASCLVLLSGCDELEGKKRVTVSVWDESLIGTPFTEKVEQLNPGFDIYWICGKDDGDFYRFQNEHGSMPDVVLVQHLDEDDALGQILFDLSATEIVSLRSEEVLTDIPGNEERTVILPADDTFTGLLANRYLFEAYGIALPEDRAGLIAACKAFEEKGVSSITGGFADQETLFEFSQTVLSGFPASEEGQLWRSAYRTGGGQDVLDDAWAPFFSEVGESIAEGLLDVADLTQDAQTARQRFIDGQAAMLFVSDEDLARFGDDLRMTVRALPNFPVDGGSPWLLVRPAFYGAVSYVDGDESDVADSEQVHENALIVLNSIMSDEAQRAYFETMGMSVPSTVLDAADSQDVPVFEQVVEPANDGAFCLAVTDPVITQAVASAISWGARTGGADDSGDGSASSGSTSGGSASDGSASGGSDADRSQDHDQGQGRGSSNAAAASGEDAGDGAQDAAQEDVDAAGSNAQMAMEETKTFESTMLESLPQVDGDLIGAAGDDGGDGNGLAAQMLAYADKQLAALKATDTRIVATFPEGMSNVWNEERGTMAANSVGLTMAGEMGADAFIMSPYALACPLYAGDMTVTELAYPINDARIYRLQLSGAQLHDLVERHVGSVGSGKELWVLSGLKMTLSHGDAGGFVLEELEAVADESKPEKASPIGQTDTQTVKTEPLDEERLYSIGVAVKPGSTNEELVVEYGGVRQSTLFSDLWVNSFQGADPKQLLASQDYLDFVS